MAVIAPAPTQASRASSWPGKPVSFIRFAGHLLAGACFCASCPAAAEVGAAVSIFSDSRFRGYSLSAGRPVGIIDLSYDDPDGLYAAVSASVVARSVDEIRPLGIQLNGGYARRLGSGITVDLGVVQSNYSRYSSASTSNSYTEVYAGISHGFLSSRIAFSPHYFENGARTLYGEIDANLSPARKLQLTGHVGVLVPIQYRDESENSETQYDWRLGLAREVGRASLHVIAAGGGPDRDYYRGHSHSRNALILGLSWTL